ncbi:Uncharacterized protein APZ42_016534 [Daphnia magna]|uniref:Uncharacterized protein n=1 Tax=Daphnia magna TaxID=35525 RepID=A0A165AG22_9CRUS|nr:Uncharacterized protein APZ42_016534 [Daphnia magna]
MKNGGHRWPGPIRRCRRALTKGKWHTHCYPAGTLFDCNCPRNSSFVLAKKK